MKFKNILLLYKRSAYKIYFMESRGFLKNVHPDLLKKELHRFKLSHDQHYNTLHIISQILMTSGVRFTESYRGRSVDYSKYDLIITVGGDGTFLEAARQIKNQVIFGVNSAPDHSVGRLCIANAANFRTIFKQIIDDKYKLTLFHRIALELRNFPGTTLALNDVLICHKNPAMLCRYSLKIGSVQEEQRSSGVWISTPVGSSGAIHSAGGKILGQHEKKIQYLPRELYTGKELKYNLKGGILNARQKIILISLMRQGMIFVDGAHLSIPFPYGASLNVSISSHSIRTIDI